MTGTASPSRPLRWRVLLHQAAAIGTKEWVQIARDPSAFGLVVILPLILMLLFGSALSLDSAGTRIGIVDLDHGGAARDLVTSVEASDQFATREGPALAPMERELVGGRLRGILIVPDGFSRGLSDGHPVDIELITDGSQPNTAVMAAAHAQGQMTQWLSSRARRFGHVPVAPALAVSPRFTYNPGLQSRFMLVQGAMAIVLAMIGCLLTALVVAREYERGTMEGLLSTPIPVPVLILAKVVPYFLLGLGSTGLCAAVAVLGYGLPFRGSVLALLAICSSFLTAALGQGLLISAATRNQFLSIQFALLSSFLPSLLLSGFLYEIDSMPMVVRWVTWLVPARYLVGPLQTVFLVGDVWAEFLPNIVILLGFGLVFFWRVNRAIGRKLA